MLAWFMVTKGITSRYDKVEPGLVTLMRHNGNSSTGGSPEHSKGS